MSRHCPLGFPVLRRFLFRGNPLPPVSRLNINCYENHSIKKLFELRQQEAALKSHIRTMLETAISEKRSLNDEEGKQFDELRARADALEIEITASKSLPKISAICMARLLKVKA